MKIFRIIFSGYLADQQMIIKLLSLRIESKKLYAPTFSNCWTSESLVNFLDRINHTPSRTHQDKSLEKHLTDRGQNSLCVRSSSKNSLTFTLAHYSLYLSQP